MEFEEWLEQLDVAAKQRGYAGDSFSQGTGADCWRASFEAGLSPADALTEDESEGV